MDNPRIVTLDPTGSVGRIVRGALELLDLSPVQIDCPTEASARAEIGRGATLFVIAGDLAGESGMDLAFDLAADQRELPVFVIADEEVDVPDDAPYVLLHRATDAIRIVKAIDAALSAKDVRAALRQTASIPLIVEPDSGGSVPGLDLEHAKRILDQLVVDVGALSCILATRDGHLLLERGMVSSGLERERLVSMLAPTMKMGRDVKEVVGGQLSSIQFFDGEVFDVFVLSVGLHHFLCVVYDGNGGARQFGSVNRFGRRAAEDVIALVGANAFIWQSPHPVEHVSPSRSTTRVKAVKVEKPVEEPLEMPIARAELSDEPTAPFIDTMPTMEPIRDLDLDALFGSDLSGADSDDLFDMDALEDLGRAAQQGKGKLDWDQAKEIGLIS